ncbi:hypothetical protein HETIRDRAFT_101758 [Heterobasidion irregulare TC 32-1]|uniref:Uncharacterized protein n=1 Tax=Heterobasidion irregulare (strain TC 32-1) TaxID=747525 RepID=W4K5H8_HETIT|nr:uncharacterized protein HETIRDRAFT_101758 [Heterobasidion irregulare TC 32-1]ETW80620.1 hypothetical protein HETIRDRAFT_101758 [Heterobasidion irregulare TC 32-1]
MSDISIATWKGTVCGHILEASPVSTSTTSWYIQISNTNIYEAFHVVAFATGGSHKCAIKRARPTAGVDTPAHQKFHDLLTHLLCDSRKTIAAQFLAPSRTPPDVAAALLATRGPDHGLLADNLTTSSLPPSSLGEREARPEQNREQNRTERQNQAAHSPLFFSPVDALEITIFFRRATDCAPSDPSPAVDSLGLTMVLSGQKFDTSGSLPVQR